MSKPWPIFVGTKEAVVAGNLTVRDDRLDDNLFTLVGENVPTKAGTLSQQLHRICEQVSWLVLIVPELDVSNGCSSKFCLHSVISGLFRA